METAYLEKPLSERDKPMAFVGGHTGALSASTVDGVAWSTAEAGGFTGWTLAGVTRNTTKAELRPHVDTGFEHLAGDVSDGGTVGRVTRSTRGRRVRCPAGTRGTARSLLGALTAIRPGQVKIPARTKSVTSSADVRAGLRAVA